MRLDRATGFKRPNHFTVESEFLAHYDRAREIARYSPNHIRVCDGENLLGVPVKDENGATVVGPDGKALWTSVPRGGWIPDPDALPGSPTWKAVHHLAPHMQSALIAGDPARPGLIVAATRVTPEVRIERVEHNGTPITFPVRTLSIEISTLCDPMAAITKKIAEAFRDESAPLIRAWFPLHNELDYSWVASHPQRMDDTPDVWFNRLLLRFRAPHEMVS